MKVRVEAGGPARTYRHHLGREGSTEEFQMDPRDRETEPTALTDVLNTGCEQKGSEVTGAELP